MKYSRMFLVQSDKNGNLPNEELIEIKALDKAFELGDVLEDIIEKEIRHYKNNDKIERALLAWNKFKDEV